jgi:adenylate cyclase
MPPGMNHSLSQKVWLEGSAKTPIPIGGGCSLGRSVQNQVVLKDSKASRHHAVIHLQAEGEYWLVDFGSTNGTNINNRRVLKPTRLRDWDQIYIGDECFTFRQDAACVPRNQEMETTNVTDRDIKTVDCWLLVADIEGSTLLSRTLPPDELPVVLGRWFASCKETIDTHDGQINKFLGDGFFAYWIEHPNAATKVANAVQKLSDAQGSAQLKFRWVLHTGPVALGGTTRLGEESLLGSEVNYTFRMEALAGNLNLARLVSDSARAKLPLNGTLRDVGLHPLSGFDGSHRFHTF